MDQIRRLSRPGAGLGWGTAGLDRRCRPSPDCCTRRIGCLLQQEREDRRKQKSEASDAVTEGMDG